MVLNARIKFDSTLLGEQNPLVGPHNVGIKDESINHALSDSEVEGTNDDHK